MAILETALFAALVIYDHVLEFIIRGEKCIFVGSCTIQVRIRNAFASKAFLQHANEMSAVERALQTFCIGMHARAVSSSIAVT